MRSPRRASTLRSATGKRRCPTSRWSTNRRKGPETRKLPDVKPEQHFTQPPPRFSEASLVKELEEQGIGRPSTYANIMSTIQDRGYVERKEARFYPTMLGTKVNDLLVESFPDILD